jgi:hypothetical protein
LNKAPSANAREASVLVELIRRWRALLNAQPAQPGDDGL